MDLRFFFFFNIIQKNQYESYSSLKSFADNSLIPFPSPGVALHPTVCRYMLSPAKADEESRFSSCFGDFLTETPMSAAITQVVLTEENSLEISLLGPQGLDNKGEEETRPNVLPTVLVFILHLLLFLLSLLSLDVRIHKFTCRTTTLSSSNVSFPLLL